MAKSLVIVESPAKAKTINKYLGPDYIVKSSMGHIRDLPVRSTARTKSPPLPGNLSEEKKARLKKEREHARAVRTMAVDPENGWRARYEILPGKRKVLRELKAYAEKALAVYLATDLDREGEAIAWHLRESIGGDLRRYKRVTFSEITKSAIQKAFADPTDLDMNRVNAQQARRFLDRVVGYMLSPLLWKKVARGLSAGRVQSVAVRLVVEREREIRAFTPEEYWKIFAFLEAAPPFSAQVVKFKDKSFSPADRKEVDEAIAVLKDLPYVVAKNEQKPAKQNPYPPFITTTLQAAASTRLGFSVKRTMMLAQRLYEAGFITYMRTDSTQLSSQSVEACRNYIRKEYGDRYVPEKPRIYASRARAQEAHEAIRPTDVSRHPGLMPDLDPGQARLYELIWRQFVACQMNAAEFDTTSIVINAGDYELRARGRVMRFDGWMRVFPPMSKKDDEDVVLPQVHAGQTLPLIELKPTQHFTKPPARYTEASLVKELEKRGIGRPSTYAPIISTIQERGYVQLVKRRFYAQKIGDIVTDRLVENFQDLMDYGFTASMEEELDSIANGDIQWKKVLDEFYADFQIRLKNAETGMRRNVPVVVEEILCPACRKPMNIRTARTGIFLSCSGYDAPLKERCKQTINLVPGDEAVSATDSEEQETKELLAKHRCPKCGTAMESYLVDEQRKLHICGNSPDCSGYEVEKGHFRIKGYDGPTIECDKCGDEMVLKTGRFGKFFACRRYPECSNTRKLMRDGKPAPPKADPVPMPELKCEKSDAHFILRDGAAGVFLAASTFPKSRETKSPLVEDLARHRNELDPKFHYLADAPQTDPDGNRAEIRFKRKEKIQYLKSIRDGKETGWNAFYRDGTWQWTKSTSKKKETKSV